MKFKKLLIIFLLIFTLASCNQNSNDIDSGRFEFSVVVNGMIEEEHAEHFYIYYSTWLFQESRKSRLREYLYHVSRDGDYKVEGEYYPDQKRYTGEYKIYHNDDSQNGNYVTLRFDNDKINNGYYVLTNEKEYLEANHLQKIEFNVKFNENQEEN